MVAADKGTATFSDLANEISRETASLRMPSHPAAPAATTTRRWAHRPGRLEAVKRHFRELGVDIQNKNFTVVGVGDMSGDVFGNAMLLSQRTRLIAAFDHRHIFIDPIRTPKPPSVNDSACSTFPGPPGTTTTAA